MGQKFNSYALHTDDDNICGGSAMFWQGIFLLHLMSANKKARNEGIEAPIILLTAQRWEK